jgi:16S rRNA (guanine527-N7)-methyltransferase
VDLLASASAHGVRLAPDTDKRLLLFCREVCAESPFVNLVSSSDLPHIVTKHVAASLGVLLVEHPRVDQRWVDVGTGGGFPGVVVKICCPEAKIVLLDSSEKKTRVLDGLRSKLALEDLEVLRGRVQDLGTLGIQGTEGSRPASVIGRGFDLILMRAVASLAESLGLIESVASPKARFLTFKGPAWEQEVRLADEAMRRHGWRFRGITPIPWARSRILCLDRG